MKAAHYFPSVDLDSIVDDETEDYAPTGFYLSPDEEQCECGGIRDGARCPFCDPSPPPATDELSLAELRHDADVEALLNEKAPEQVAVDSTSWAPPSALARLRSALGPTPEPSVREVGPRGWVQR